MGPVRFARGCALLCLAVAVALLPLGAVFGLQPMLWSLLGFWMMAVIGVAGGAWLVASHGSPGPAFPIAVATCILARLVLAGAGGFAAATRGMEAVYAYLAGLGACYVPVQVFEMNWFLKRDRLSS